MAMLFMAALQLPDRRILMCVGFVAGQHMLVCANQKRLIDDRNLRMTSSLLPHAEHENIADNDKYHLARRYHALLTNRVETFRSRIGPSHEVGLRLVGLGTAEVFYLDEIHHADPALIAFCGVTLDGMPFEVIQDVSLVNVALQALPQRAVKR